ncbi:L-threonine O-3-phosphate decarboxylase [Methanospirillum hungatei JF-1]|jgi:threonine-phosphate decarboxylase|uniref:L-threonine O-3-phosphate decarboxylase n=1 Tax=Methanospirillum hungatei JF-1 (strain ATCC 27890 / DSM 864 / NBRC 100397 / JF-1) TaxID=323259 RepID=Q2FN55_METHJ|nr:histidinol-phosphate transaminase [Methanospirillum hungatei]ABD40690.1 L-threonine O-3-phosphate decarboxylase [Methanospirillum hungatei JF-1]
MRYKSELRAVHGGRAKYIAGNEREILDFSANINPYPPKLDLSIPEDALTRYPDDEYLVLKEVIARHHGCKPEHITVGNGSVEVIRTLCHTVLDQNRTYFVPDHTFAEYELSARLTGAQKAKTEKESTLSFICNPDNPTGVLLPKQEIISRFSWIRSDQILCIDEAFIDLSDPSQSVSDIRDPRLFVLRSLTKSFAIPGIRFGYGIGDPDLIASMEVMRPPWTVNAFAEKVVLSAFSKYHDLEYSRKMIEEEKTRLMETITTVGWSCSKASANYLLIETDRPSGYITDLFFKNDILVRDCSSFGLSTSIRIAIRTKEENDRFIEVLEKISACLHS